MPRIRCRICGRRDRKSLDRALLTGQSPGSLAKELGLPAEALARHRKLHFAEPARVLALGWLRSSLPALQAQEEEACLAAERETDPDAVLNRIADEVALLGRALWNLRLQSLLDTAVRVKVRFHRVRKETHASTL